MDLVGLCRAACLCPGGRAWRQPRSTRLGVGSHISDYIHHILFSTMPFERFSKAFVLFEWHLRPYSCMLCM